MLERTCGRSLAIRLLAGWFAIFAAVTLQAGELRWRSVVTGRDLSLTVREPASVRAEAPGVIFYLLNLASARIGTENDATLIADFLADGYLVVTIDYAGDARARVPFINRDLAGLRSDLQARKLLGTQHIDFAHVFIVPSGSYLRRDVTFYRDEKRSLAMDIIYPTKPKHPVGAVLEFSCDNANRMGNASLSTCSDTIIDAQATEGFAVAMADHPVAAPYRGLDPMPESAWKIKAAVRTLRGQADLLGLNGRIVPAGFSRGSGLALMLVTTANDVSFENHGENANQRSDVDGAVVMSGRFTYLDLLPNDPMIPRYEKAWGALPAHLDAWRSHGALDYLTTAPAVRVFLTINCTESAEALHQMKALKKRLSDLGGVSEFFVDEIPRGHKVTLDPVILEAMNRYFHERLD